MQSQQVSELQAVLVAVKKQKKMHAQAAQQLEAQRKQAMQQQQEAISHMEDQREDFSTMQLLVADKADANVEMIGQVQAMREQLQLSSEKHDAAVRAL